MANEVTSTSVTESIYSEVIADSVIREIRPHNVMRGFFRQAPSGIASDTYRFLLWDDQAQYGGQNTAFNTASVEEPTEATGDLTNREVQLSTATVSDTIKGIMSTVTTLSETISLLDVWSEVKGVLTRTFVEKWESDAALELGNLATRTANGTDLTTDDILEAIAALEQRDVTDSLVGVIHTKAQGDIRTDLLAQTTSYWSRDNAQGAGWLQYSPEGYAGSIFGVPFYQTSLVNDNNGTLEGAIFAPGKTFGVLQHFDVRAEYERDASMLNTEIVLSQMYGFGIVEDVRGQGLDSNA